MHKTSLYWFRNDLRVEDNPILKKAMANGSVLAVYCFDPRNFGTTRFGFPKTGNFRAQFLLETLADLKEQLTNLNVPLVISLKKPEVILPEFVRKFEIEHLYAQKEWTSEEVKVSEKVQTAIPDKCTFYEEYEQFLWHPNDVPFSDFRNLPDVFTAFRKKCENKVPVRMLTPIPQKQSNPFQIDEVTNLPTLNDLGLSPVKKDPRSAFPFSGGTANGRKRMDTYFWKDQRLSYYKRTRNGLIGADYSSKLSPWLANGSISARMIYHEVKNYEEQIERNQDTYWLLFELFWRDYFKYISLKYGDKIFALRGIRHENYEWKYDAEALNRWINGRTACNFVNANMLELKNTGWMSNRGRQNVASYWAKTLKQDWRIGASYFESLLLDYDVHSNWGNWMYNSGVGNDPRNRTFNTSLQADRYDPEGRYQRLWLQPGLFETMES